MTTSSFIPTMVSVAEDLLESSMNVRIGDPASREIAHNFAIQSIAASLIVLARRAEKENAHVEREALQR